MIARFSVVGVGLEFISCDEIIFSVPVSLSILIGIFYGQWNNDVESNTNDYL